MKSQSFLSRRLLLAGIMLLLAATAHTAPRQTVLVEHFTNTGCDPCAYYNPGIHSVLNAMTRDTVVKISIHTWWPSSSDPFYVWNTSEAAARTNYYGVGGVPDIFVDHTLQPSPDSPTTLRSNIRTRFSAPSPCTIAISAVPVSTTQIHFVATVTADQDMTGANYRLYVMLITDLVTYATPPGSNGETTFPDPFRDAYPNANSGQSFAIGSGQSYTLDNYLNCSTSWSYNDLSVVAFVQNSTTREILQANWAEVTDNPGTLALTVPNGGETWLEGSNQQIQWTSTDLPENVRIEINRTYPTGAWSTIAASATNSGSYVWTVTGGTATAARIRIAGTVTSIVGDTSNANFSILVPSLAVIAPNGGESYILGDPIPITWSSQNVSGPVHIELNREYPGGAWETLIPETENDGYYEWTAAGATGSSCRIRITSVNSPAATDISNVSFVIGINNPPDVRHSPLDDQDVTAFTVTALVFDERSGVSVRFHYRPSGGIFSELPMTTTGNPNEYACTVGPLAEGEYDYYVSASDTYNQTTATATRTFRTAAACALELAYDDGVAEAAHWASDTTFQWAVLFNPGGEFALCGARIGVSMFRPSSIHTPIVVKVYDAYGVNGTPGSLITSKTVGSVGNVIGGGVPGTAYWADVRFAPESNPLVIPGDFYIAVSNPTMNWIEAFLHDTSGTPTGHSFVYDGCIQQWRSETATDSVTKRGNRMIRALGFSLEPPRLTAIRSSGDIVLRWNDTGAPVYNIFSTTNLNLPFDTPEGTTSDTVFTDSGAFSASSLKFYIVKGATE
ncbi:MAG: Omp28-related outer membrane protein [Calditrichota bacterium]